MVFSDQDIKAAILAKRIIIKPKPDFDVQLGSCSLDLRLGYKFGIFLHSKNPFYDTSRPIGLKEILNEFEIKEKEPYILHPGEFALASTLERIELPDDIMAQLNGRSSLGRLGVIVHGTAGIIDPGFRGTITLELGNYGVLPVALYPKMRICALIFEELKSPTSKPYYKKRGAKYRNLTGPNASKIAAEFSKKGKRRGRKS